MAEIMPLQTDGIDKSNQQTQIARVGFDKVKGMDFRWQLVVTGCDSLVVNAISL